MVAKERSDCVTDRNKDTQSDGNSAATSQRAQSAATIFEALKPKPPPKPSTSAPSQAQQGSPRDDKTGSRKTE
jgi:hypothetical protein